MTYTVTVKGARPLTVNAVAKMHRQAWATHTREVRNVWFYECQMAKVPRLTAAHVTAQPLHKDRRSPQDVAACAPEVKAAIDGLVDARRLPGDGPEHLLSLTFLPPLVCGHDGLTLRIEAA